MAFRQNLAKLPRTDLRAVGKYVWVLAGQTAENRQPPAFPVSLSGSRAERVLVEELIHGVDAGGEMFQVPSRKKVRLRSVRAFKKDIVVRMGTRRNGNRGKTMALFNNPILPIAICNIQSRSWRKTPNVVTCLLALWS
jgi:hypothetical protein